MTVIASAVLLQSGFAFRNAFESQKSIVTETVVPRGKDITMKQYCG